MSVLAAASSGIGHTLVDDMDKVLDPGNVSMKTSKEMGEHVV
jgi:hypothetical protein